MSYNFDGMIELFSKDGKETPLSRKMFDDVWVCIHCGSRKTTSITDPFYAASHSGVHTNRLDRQVHCKKCGKRLEYLEDRWYGLTAKELYKRDKTQRSHLKPWGNNPPLWAIGDSDG